jgi:hypothetical protein
MEAARDLRFAFEGTRLMHHLQKPVIAVIQFKDATGADQACRVVTTGGDA